MHVNQSPRTAVYQVIDLIRDEVRRVEYREVSKLKNGFSEMLLVLIDAKTGRIHTTYEQSTAATGRSGGRMTRIVPATPGGSNAIFGSMLPGGAMTSRPLS